MSFLEGWILILNALLIISFVMYYRLLMRYFKLLNLHKEITEKLRGLLKKENDKYNEKHYEYNCGVLDSTTVVLDTYLDFLNIKGDKKND